MTQTVEEAARAIAREWEAAWNAHDMTRLAALFTEDADLVTVAATHLRGRAQIESSHAAMHRTQFQHSVWACHETEVQALGDGFALVHQAWSIRGDLDPDGTPQGWRIRAAQNTNAVGAPPAR